MIGGRKNAPVIGMITGFAALSVATALAAASPVLAQQPGPAGAVARQAPEPRTIALASGSGRFGQVVAADLKDRGYGVVMLSPTVASLGAAPASMQPVDAILTVQAAGDTLGAPETVTAVATTPGGQVLARVNWQNYWGGWRGPKTASPQTDRHRTFEQAAAEVARDLAKTL
jgi:hypothetical protein